MLAQTKFQDWREGKANLPGRFQPGGQSLGLTPPLNSLQFQKPINFALDLADLRMMGNVTS